MNKYCQYVKYKGAELQVGIMNDFFTTYQKYITELRAGNLQQMPGNEKPENYALPNSGIRFRFPFPDEENIKFLEYYNLMERSITLILDRTEFGLMIGEDIGSPQLMELTHQRIVNRHRDGKLCLALILQDPQTKERYLIEDDAAIGKIIHDIEKNQILNEIDPMKKDFFQKVVNTIDKGFNLTIPEVIVKTNGRSKYLVYPPNKKGRKKPKFYLR